MDFNQFSTISIHFPFNFHSIFIRFSFDFNPVLINVIQLRMNGKNRKRSSYDDDAHEHDHLSRRINRKMDLIDERSEEVKKKIKERNSIFAIDMQRMGTKTLQTLETVYSRTYDLFDRGAPASRVMITCACVFLIITLGAVMYSASGHRARKQMIDEYDLTNKSVPIFEREWPLPPPYISPPASPQLLMNVLASLQEWSSRTERRGALSTCAFPAAYTVPWDLMHVRETNKTYVGARFVFGGAGTPMMIESTSRKRYLYAKPIANMTYERAFASADGMTFIEEKGGNLTLEKEVAHCVQMYSIV